MQESMWEQVTPTYLLGLEGTIPMTVILMAGLSPPLISPTYCSTYRGEGKRAAVGYLW